jgi:hypothetical protein
MSDRVRLLQISHLKSTLADSVHQSTAYSSTSPQTFIQTLLRRLVSIDEDCKY